MVKYVGLYKLKDPMKADYVMSIFKEFAENIPEILTSEIGKAILCVDGITYDFTVVATYESKETFAKYRENPLHLEKGPLISAETADVKVVMMDLEEAHRVGF